MITPDQGASIINYLFDAGALTIGSDQQGEVWADYLNHTIPDIHILDLRPAVRDCLTVWAAERRAWKIDVARYAQSVKRIRRMRIEAYTREHGQICPTDPDVNADTQLFLIWKRAATSAIHQGATTPDQVNAYAYQAIGRRPPPPEITETRNINFDQIGRRHGS